MPTYYALDYAGIIYGGLVVSVESLIVHGDRRDFVRQNNLLIIIFDGVVLDT